MREVTTRMVAGLAAALALLGLAGCGKPVNPNDQPVSFWANPQNGIDSDPCVHATAQAIVKSGLPYPNFSYEEVTKPDGTQEKRAKTVDVWVGSARFVLPAKMVASNGMYAKSHPMRFWKLQGNLPNFYPSGEPGPVINGMGPMVDVTIRCSVDPQYVAAWGKGYQSNAEGIARVKQQYEKQLADNPKYPGTVTVSIREDIGMTEVLLDRDQEANNRRFWEATYWPLKQELKGMSGSVSEIKCTTRNDPQRRYGGVGWRCMSGIRLTPSAGVSIEIYVSQIQHMPAVFEQVKKLFANAKQ